jgi:Tfp pilus assembly protein PilV
MNKQPVFSVNELLIAVAIILSIAVIAMPNLLRAHLADSDYAVNSTQVVVGTDTAHRSSHSPIALPDSSAQLEPRSPGTTCMKLGQTRSTLLQGHSVGTSPPRRFSSDRLRFSHPRRKGNVQSAVSAPTSTSALFPSQ